MHSPGCIRPLDKSAGLAARYAGKFVSFKPGLCIGSCNEAAKAPTWVRCATHEGYPPVWVGPRKRTLEYVEEADRVERRRCAAHAG